MIKVETIDEQNRLVFVDCRNGEHHRLVVEIDLLFQDGVFECFGLKQNDVITGMFTVEAEKMEWNSFFRRAKNNSFYADLHAFAQTHDIGAIIATYYGV